MSVEALHQLLEHLSAVLEVLELVERGASGREEDDVARRREARRSVPGAIPAQSAHAVAASTFSTLWAPRRTTSATGQISSTWSLSRAAIQPSRTKTPCSRARTRLNQTTWARVRGASARVGSSSALSTAQSAGVWLAKIRALASA